MKKITRKRFIKDSMLLGTTIKAFSAILSCKARNTAYGRKTVVHPNVDNLRVVGMTDPKMTIMPSGLVNGDPEVYPATNPIFLRWGCFHQF